MPRSSAERWLVRLVLLSLAALGAAGAFAQTPLAGPLRLVDVIEVNDHEDQVDLTMVFNCSMRFINSLPASEGHEVHIQLAPLADCRVSPVSQIAPETPPVSGGGSIVSSARVESLAPGQITLTLSFNKNERFVVAQGVDPRGLRLRLIDRARGHGKILVGQSTEEVANFAINLDSQPKPFSPEEIQAAHERLKAPAFVSEATVEGEKWYRLRVGPIERRSEADRLLNVALPYYPRAWLAIGDDAVTSDANAATAQVAPPVERMGSDPSLPPEELRKLMAAARTAIDKHEYPTAIALLTKLQRQPEFPERARAQELLGLARERSGQLAHAKAEYEEYLRRYPQGEAAERVAFRLKILRAAEAKARTGRQVAGDNLGWEMSGGVAQMARYDGERITNGAPPPSTTPTPVPAAPTINQNALFNDVDLFARRRGESFDLVGRISAGYDKSFTKDQGTVGNPTRVTLASLEVLDRPLGLLGRLGRQASNDYGILGTFDGLFLSWQFLPSWAINAAGGYPVEQLILSPQTRDRFETLALAYAPRGAHWDASLFAANETFEGFRARRAVGMEGRFLASNASLVGLVDYDTQFHSLNTASVVGTVQLPARWSVSFDAERRNSPVLNTRNALIGTTFTNLNDLLLSGFTLDDIYQLAKDRTPITDSYSITVNKPLTPRLQFTTIVSATETGATPASAGVAAIPASGMLLTYQGQIYASSLWRTGDFHVVTFTYGNTVIGKIESVSTNSRFPIGGAWRLGPRFTVERLNAETDGSTNTTYVPSILFDYERERKLFQFEVGGQLGKREAFLQLSNGQFVQTQNTTRYYVSVSYRLSFQ